MEALCLDIVNSDWHDWHGGGRDEDRLFKEGWLEQLLKHWRFDVPVPVDEQQRERIQEVRAMMQKIIEQVLQEKILTDQELTPLNGYLKQSPHVYQVISGGEQVYLEQVDLGTEWEKIIGEIVLSFAKLLSEGAARIKQCENPHCRWTYYDESANQTRLWCDESCANLMRVRRFREKRKRAVAE